MKVKVNLAISFDIDADNISEKLKEELAKKIHKTVFVDKNEIIKNIDIISVNGIKFIDNDGMEYRETYSNNHKVEYYKPACKYGYIDCVYDPMYIKYTDPCWWKELGCPTTCENCENGNGYDDEDK